jgi:serine/threonine protein kinase
VGVFPQPRPERFGRYILLDRINVGGMAEVFRGRQFGVEGFARNIALKRILPNISKDDPDFKEMFIDEAKLTVQLQHANVVQVYDLGSVDDPSTSPWSTCRGPTSAPSGTAPATGTGSCPSP